MHFLSSVLVKSRRHGALTSTLYAHVKWQLAGRKKKKRGVLKFSSSSSLTLGRYFTSGRHKAFDVFGDRFQVFFGVVGGSFHLLVPHVRLLDRLGCEDERSSCELAWSILEQ